VSAVSPLSRSAAVRDPAWLKWSVIGLAAGFMGLMLILPLITVFAEAFRRGAGVFLAAISEHDARAAIQLTLLVVAIIVPLNTIFGIAAAWAVTRFEFRGKTALLTLIDLPFSISPVISGLVFVLLYGAHGWFGPTLAAMGIEVIFTVTAVVLATLLVTMPFVARELIPLMQAQGGDEEAAGVTLGATPWAVFFKVTLPNIKWALTYGVLLCSARAMGEFGAVAVVSGHIRGKTATMPLHVEILYNEFSFTAAFSIAALLAMFSLVTLAVKSLLEDKVAADFSGQRRP
jgi:sulfate/thiosulfate transport system permease protein